jgi:hypothetical protein
VGISVNAASFPGSPEGASSAGAELLSATANDVRTRYVRPSEAPHLDAGSIDVRPGDLSTLEVAPLGTAVADTPGFDRRSVPMRVRARTRSGAAPTDGARADHPAVERSGRDSLEAGLRGRRRYTLAVLLAADVTTLALALVGGQLARLGLTGRGSVRDALASTIYVPIFVVVLNCYGMYERSRRRLVASSFPDLGRLAHALFAASLVVLFTAGGFHRWFGAPSVDRVGVTLIATFALAGIPLGRAVARILVRHPERYGSRVLIVG